MVSNQIAGVALECSSSTAFCGIVYVCVQHNEADSANDVSVESSLRVVDGSVRRFLFQGHVHGEFIQPLGCECIPAFQTISLRMGSRPARKPTTSLSSKFLYF